MFNCKLILRNCSLKFKRHFNSYSNSEKYDYLIVGAGSAGCVLANRLTENGKNSVCLLEAGPSDKTQKISMPAALMYNLADDKYNWYYTTLEQKFMNNRRMYQPRGRVMGGSSSLNAMVYIRGHALDYERWCKKEGAESQGYADCLPYFKKAERRQLGANTYRGGSGPLGVTTASSVHCNPLHNAFIEAGNQAGYSKTEDLNGQQQEGFGLMDMTIQNGKRSNSSSAYIDSIQSRKNFFLKSNTLVEKLEFDKQMKCVGVKVSNRLKANDSQKFIEANEVILCGGAINSPQLLMLSGIGNSTDLSEVGVDLKLSLRGVGNNLQDHLEIYVQQRCTQPITLYDTQKFGPKMILSGIQQFLNQSGPCATSHLESGAFIRSQPNVEHPDIQYHFLPSVVNDHGRKLGTCHAYQCHVGPMRPKSRGFIKLKSKNPREHPLIQPNYLKHEDDIKEFRDCIHLTREIFSQNAFKSFRHSELLPGDSVQTVEEIDNFICKHADSAYHPCSTCKMGSEMDKMSVIDPLTMKVYGTDSLRIVDASVMPSMISGNLNAPTIMIAEKAADIILGKRPEKLSENKGNFVDVILFRTDTQRSNKEEDKRTIRCKQYS